MKRVGVREFKEKATVLISEEKAFVIEKHGKPVGVYLPLAKKDEAKTLEAVEKLEATIAGILLRTGMTHKEFEAAWNDAGRAGRE